MGRGADATRSKNAGFLQPHCSQGPPQGPSLEKMGGSITCDWAAISPGLVYKAGNAGRGGKCRRGSGALSITLAAASLLLGGCCIITYDLTGFCVQRHSG